MHSALCGACEIARAVRPWLKPSDMEGGQHSLPAYEIARAVRQAGLMAREMLFVIYLLSKIYLEDHGFEEGK